MKAQKIYKFNFILSRPDYHPKEMIDLWIKTPDQDRPIMVRQRKGGGHICVAPPGMEMGQLPKKNWGEKRNGWVASSLPLGKLLNNFNWLSI